MELKQITLNVNIAAGDPLIVPYGIETILPLGFAARYNIPLIVPYGIETWLPGGRLAPALIL